MIADIILGGDKMECIISEDNLGIQYTNTIKNEGNKVYRALTEFNTGFYEWFTFTK